MKTSPLNSGHAGRQLSSALVAAILLLRRQDQLETNFRSAMLAWRKAVIQLEGDFVGIAMVLVQNPVDSRFRN